MEKTIKNIEQAVLSWFEIDREDLYSCNRIYPIDGARSVFMYLLWESGVKIREIQKMFGYKTGRTIYFQMSNVRKSIETSTGKLCNDVYNVKNIIEMLTQ